MRQIEPVLRDDGRQSAIVREVQRGALRHLAALGAFGIPEFTLVSGRRADIVAVDPRGEILIVEIKSCLADFRADRKWPEYRAFCDRLAFAVAPDFPLEILPQEAGLLVADAFGAQWLREAPCHPLPAATRKALLVRLSRTAAARLSALYDPDLLRADPL